MTIVKDMPDNESGRSSRADPSHALPMACRTAFTALVCSAFIAALPGCVWYGPHSMTRLWADHNTLNRPAFFMERLAHGPPPRERVERFRWQYGVGPGVPFAVPSPAVLAPQAAEEAASEAEATGAPPAPPPEPLPPLPTSPEIERPASVPPYPAEARSRPLRHSLAWMFTPARG